MQVLLRENVDKLGNRGDVVKVAPGYARNFLIPKKFAMPVTEGNKRQLEIEHRNYEKKMLAKQAVAAEAKAKIEELRFKIAKKAGESNQLFGSVTAQEVAELLMEKGFEIDRRKLEIPHVKELGEYEIQVRLHSEVTASIALEVVAQ